MFRARERAQMNSTPPEANNEYSRAPGASRGDVRGLRAGDSRALKLHGDGVGNVIAAGGLLAAAVLIAAEFMTLYTVHVIGRLLPIRSIATGSHHGYALIPIGVLAIVLSIAVQRGAGRPALIALAALGIITLVIALLGDLPDAHRRGLIASGAGFELGQASPSRGFYLETLGAVLLLIVAGVGSLAGAGRGPHPDIRRTGVTDAPI
jgi:hypothetical protein